MDWMQLCYYMQQIHAYLEAQNQQIAALKTTVEKLQKDISQLSEKNTPSVVRNEYKFDLLKVEKLEGTLNIGLNPNSKDAAIGEMDVSQSLDVPAIERQNPGLFKNIQQQTYDYLNGPAHDYIRSISAQYGFQLGDEYCRFITEDIKKQIDNRINYYLGQYPDGQISPEQLPEVEQTVRDKVITDINKSCDAFVHNLPKGGWS